MTQANLSTARAEDFSLVLGGPLFQLFRRARLSGHGLELMRRRIVFIALFAWLPLLVLALADGTAIGEVVAVPFLFDFDAQVRFLVALPLLIWAERIVHERMLIVVGQFTSQGLVTDAIRPRFDAALESARKLRNSVSAEVLIVAFVYIVGVLVLWRSYMALEVPTWYAIPEGATLRPRLAGWWYLLVALPVFQFILLRWYFRLFIWTRFLWQVSRLPLAYAPMHPDRLGGIGFLSRVGHAFAPLLLAQGALLAGSLANKILYTGAKLPSFQLVGTTLLPIAPLLLTIVSPEELLKRFVSIVF